MKPFKLYTQKTYPEFYTEIIHIYEYVKCEKYGKGNFVKPNSHST